MDPALAPDDTVARGTGRSITRHWSWLPRRGGPPSPHPVVCEGGDVTIGLPGVSSSFAGADTDAVCIRRHTFPVCAKERDGTLGH